MFSRFILVCQNFIPFNGRIYFSVWIIHIYPSVVGHLDWFYLLGSAAVNILVQIFVGTPDFNSCRYMSRRGIARSYGDSVLLIKEPPNDFPQWLDHFTFPPPISPRPCCVSQDSSEKEPTGCSYI